MYDEVGRVKGLSSGRVKGLSSGRVKGRFIGPF